MYDLLRATVAVVPEIVELELNEAMAGLRPGSPDNGPVLGAAATSGSFPCDWALPQRDSLEAPLTADALFDALSGRAITGPAAAFSPQRFSVAAPAHELRRGYE